MRFNPNSGNEEKTAEDYAEERFRWESSRARARLVDSLGYTIASYGSVEAARETLARDRARQAADGLRPGELDYETVSVREA